MSIALVLLLVLAAVALLVAFWVIGAYNGLVTLRNRFKNAFAQIDVQLKRRYDLIPNLVETAKGYLKHERETLEAVIAARNTAFAASKAAAAKSLSSLAVTSMLAPPKRTGNSSRSAMRAFSAHTRRRNCAIPRSGSSGVLMALRSAGNNSRPRRRARKPSRAIRSSASC